MLTDLPGGGFGSAGLALDTTHQLLFANVGDLVDEVDTATNQEVAGSQQNVDGGVVAILGGAGYAALVTDEPVPDGGLPDGSSESTFFSLEPGNVTLTKLAESVVPSPMSPGRYIVVFDSQPRDLRRMRLVGGTGVGRTTGRAFRSAALRPHRLAG